jgi:glycosyltransferase involved in cell wall biosynthesis
MLTPGTILFAVVAALWLLLAVIFARGMRRLPKLADAVPLPDAKCPRVSIIFSARDEAEHLPRALASMLALDYPDYEVIAVNDRSRDATPHILADLAQRHARLKVIHVDDLPAGWLGKTHGLWRGYRESRGEWLLFTDGDVRFTPDALRRAMSLVQERGWDHFSPLCWIDMTNFWKKAAVTCFGMLAAIVVQPWKISDPKSKRFAGAGYFNLVRRAAYEASGTHTKLALEVVDDVKLGKIVKQSGFRSGSAAGGYYVTLDWYDGVGGMVRGFEKNGFAGLYFSVTLTGLLVAAALVVHILPFVALFAAEGWARIFAALAAGTAVTLHGAAAADAKQSPLLGLTYPFCVLILLYALLRSTALTLWQGGIVWRGTFYPLKELRKGMV